LRLPVAIRFGDPTRSNGLPSFLLGLGLTPIHRDPNFTAILQTKARRLLMKIASAMGNDPGK
jgi:hypothetical protein